MFKRLLVVILLITEISPASAVGVPATFAFTGAGYGHGVGMSQIGAKAHALNGETATTILNYYYKDVQIAPIIDTQTIRVNIGHSVTSANFYTTGDGVISIYRPDSELLQATSSGSKKLSVSVNGNWAMLAGIKSQSFTLRWNTVLTYAQGGATSKYKYGFITIKVVKGALEITNTLALRDEYLWGISEVPSNWPAAALEAQVIASRSYALSKLGAIKASCNCDVYSHISDQNFVGYTKELEPKIGQLWKAAVSRTIIDSTTSLAILNNGKPIQAYFFSSSGGATQTSQDAWGAVTPFTQSVSDSSSVDVLLNPRFAKWSALATQELVAKAFLLPDVVTLEILSRNSAGAVTYLKATSSSGVTKQIRGDTFRSRVKIPSPWFNLVSVQN